ncbi:MAG: leucine-rich repeat protein, partial [Treponema sp.]|nr:leucine-rich repeat protein [Treponema sp.]
IQALYYAFHSEKEPYIHALEEFKQKRIEKLLKFIESRQDLAQKALADGEIAAVLNRKAAEKKNESNIYLHDKTEYVHCGRTDFYNVTILKFELNNSLKLFKNFYIENYILKEIDSWSSGQTIDIPFGIIGIDDYAFSRSGCSTVVIPGSVRSIGRRAFENCSGLASIVIPNGVETIEDYTFSGCTSLESVTLPNSIKSIKAAAFMNCENLSQIKLPQGLTHIDAAAFMNCKSLSQLKLPDGLASIGDTAFHGCQKIASIKIPENVTWAGKTVFWEWKADQTVIIHNEHFEKWHEDWNSYSLAKIVYRGAAQAVRKEQENREDLDTITASNKFLRFCIDNEFAEAKALWAKGSVDLNFKGEGYRRTALVLAAEQGFLDLVTWLLEIGSALEAADSNGRTALAKAAIRGDTALMELLINAGANINALDNDNDSVLSLAIDGSDPLVKKMEHGTAAALLLIAKGAEVHTVNKNKRTPLHQAAIKDGFAPVIGELLKKGAAIVPDRCDKTPLDYAKKTYPGLVDMMTNAE